MNQENLEQLQKVFEQLAEHFRQQFSEQLENCRKMSEAVSLIFADLQPRIEPSCDRLANLGWTLPMRFGMGQLVELAEHSNTVQELEQCMLEHFTCERGRFFVDLRRDLLRNENLSFCRGLLEQCFNAYERGHYLIVIPALILIIEGTLARIAGIIKRRSVEKVAAELEKSAPPGSIEFLVWRSARLVLEQLFASFPFDGSHPGQLNRHWILHGRDETQWTQMDALRLFNCLHTVSV